MQHHPKPSVVRTLCCLALVAGASACASTKSSIPSDGQGPWLRPSASLQEQIDRRAAQVPWTNVFEEQIELIQWFTSVGEPAYPTLLAMAVDPRPMVSGSALAALGGTRDARLVEHVRGLPEPEEGDVDLRLERARCLLMLGDWNEIPHLIRGLRDERVYTRAVCARSLQEATRESFGFQPKADEEEREQAIERWEQWWSERSADSLISG